METTKQQIKELAAKRTKSNIIQITAMIRTIDKQFELGTCLCGRPQMDAAWAKITSWINENINE